MLLMKTVAILLFTFAAGAFAQSADTAPVFEVASVRVSTSGGGRGHMNMFASPIKVVPGSLTMRGISFRAAVAWANDVKEFQVNGPSWIDEARYDIVAKAAGPAPSEELRPMLR